MTSHADPSSAARTPAGPPPETSNTPPMAAETNDHADVIVRPPLLYLGFLAAGLVVDFFLPAPFLPALAQYVAGAAAIAGGIGLMAAAMRSFRAAGTTVPTNEPTSAIVTTGPYRFSRNPIYLALSLIYAGIGLAVDSAWALGLLAPVLAIMHFGVVLREERYLAAKFGDEYRRYTTKVRRWL